MTSKVQVYKYANSALTRSGRVCLLFGVLMVLNTMSWGQCTAVTDLKKDKLTDLSLYFYPSTLRMANLENNEEFNRLIQDIEKMVFYKMNGKFEHIDFYNLNNELQSENEFEEYVVVDGPKKRFYLLGRENPVETVGLVTFEDTHYVFDIAGRLELKELPKLYEYIANNDEAFQSKFSQLLDLAEIGQEMTRDHNH